MGDGWCHVMCCVHKRWGGGALVGERRVGLASLVDGRSSEFLVDFNRGGAAYEAFLEQENEAQIASLGNKVSELRALSIHIGQHVKSDNALLDELDGNFNSALPSPRVSGAL
ncbi:MAG: hypothetical protein SGPRY_006830 [Prymnesium sp.]